MVWIRWLLVPLTPVAVLAAVALASYVVMQALALACPAERFAGGVCMAAWHTTALGAILAVLGVATAAYLVAPRAKRPVAVLGCIPVAAAPGTIYWASGWQEFIPLAVAGISLWWIFNKTRKLAAP